MLLNQAGKLEYYFTKQNQLYINSIVCYNNQKGKRRKI